MDDIRDTIGEAPTSADVRCSTGDPHLDKLWTAFRVSADRASREALILAYEPLVSAVASRLPAATRDHWELNDLRSCGLLGLIDAIDRFGPQSPPAAFRSYAAQRIRGAIYDELRRLDWLPRTIRRHVISYRTAADQLSSDLGRTPASAEVLASMGVDPISGGRVLQDVQASQLTHLDSAGPDPDGALPYRLIDQLVSDRDDEPEPRMLASERLEELRVAVAGLPERQRTVVTLHFLGGLTQEQTAAVLGVSGARVHQIKGSAIDGLRRSLANRRPPSPAGRTPA